MDAEDSKWFEELLEEYDYHLRCEVGKILYGWHDSPLMDRDDLMQEARIICFESWKSFDENKGCSFKTYLIRNLKWRLVDYVRKLLGRLPTSNARVMSLGTDYYEDLVCDDGYRWIDRMESDCMTPEEEYEIKEFREIFSKAYSELTDNQRLVVELYYFGGMTLLEVAEEMGVSESRICQVHKDALRRMRGYLKEKKLYVELKSSGVVVSGVGVQDSTAP